MPVLTRSRCSRAADVFFGGDAALGPKNIIWAVAQGPCRRDLDR
jgi:NADPH-dependent glutamate synthase beta subunit-like oxidoreductase